MNTDHLFVKLKFSEEQLQAIKDLYYKYFDPKMPKTEEYRGTGNIAMWREGLSYDFGRTKSEGLEKMVNGFDVHECNGDPLWEVFGDLLPHMGKSATITKMPPRSQMIPHIDRVWRPIPIYFPIEGCNENVVSTCYSTPKENLVTTGDGHPAFIADQSKVSIDATFSIKDNAYLTNTLVLHGVENKQDIQRIAFGWNFRSPDLTYDQCLEILRSINMI